MSFTKTIKEGYNLAKEEVRETTKGSRIGFWWYFIEPLAIFTSLLLIFGHTIKQSIPQYPLYLFIGMMLLRLFQNTSREALLLQNKKSKINKNSHLSLHTFLESVVIKNLFIHLGEFLVFVIIMIFIAKNILPVLFYIPLIILMSLFLYGFSLTLFTLNFYTRDIYHVWQVISRSLWFITPVFYQLGTHKWLTSINLFNPIYYFITLFREIIIYKTLPEIEILTGAISITFLFLLLGTVLYRKSELRIKKKLSE